MGVKPNEDDVFEGQQLLQTGIFGVLYTVAKARRSRHRGIALTFIITCYPFSP
jgi:hypothetical protein